MKIKKKLKIYSSGGKDEDKKYQEWKSKLPKNLQYEGNYDLRGFYNENPNFNVNDPNQHLTDKFKLPNHPTFSNESKYFNMIQPQILNQAGHWQETDSSFNYIPYNTMYKDTLIEKKQNGGSLKKYGKGGEIPEKKKIEDSFVDANNFLKSWQQSPMYNEMLNNSSSGNEYSKISNYRNKSLNLNPTNNLNVEKTLLNDPNTTGFVRKGTPIVNISSDWHNNNEMLSRLKTESDTLKARLGETPDYKIPTNFVTPSTIVHEMSHITDWKGLPKTDLQKIKSFSSDRDKNKFSNYVANPSETRSRLNEIRYENSLLKYYNPLTEKINKDQYNNYLKDKSKGNALKDLKNVYSDDEIIDMLNSISENKSSQEQIPMAKNGGNINNTDSSYNYIPYNTMYKDTIIEKFKNGGSIKKYPLGGRPQFEWSKGIDNIQPITQTQNNSSITTGNKKLSTEELKKAAEYTKKYNQQHLEEEYNNRQNKLKQSIDAQKQPLSLKNLQTQTQSTGDKFSLAMNSKYGNPKDYPTLSGYIQGLDYINPFKMIGDMASGLGSAPQDVNEGNYLKAGLSVASPLFTGAVAGIGTQGLKPFVNNIVNPLAGTGEVINNLGNKYLPNTYKLNPSAFKPNSEAYYRIIGNEEGLDDLVNSGVLRSNPNNLNKKGSLMYKDPYFSKGVIFDKDYYKNNPYKGKYVAEVSDIEMHHNPPGSFSFDNNIAIPKDPIKINNPNLKLYQKDWLKGYKPIEIPKKGFNSEINWGKWNKEIPQNKALIQEYNTIEQTSKANGTWMKNPDGSPFQGTPEQFVQQNSENFKKAFPNGYEKGFRGDMTGDAYLTGDVGDNRTIFIADKETGKHYAGSKGNLFELYHPKSENSINLNNQGRSWRNISRTPFGENPPNLDVLSGRLNTPQIGNYTSTDDIAEWIQKNNKDYVNINNIFDGTDAEFVRMVNHKPGNYLKSAIGNNGMFDMTNPNIYKTLVPGVIGLGAASQIDKKQNGGSLKKYPNGGDLKNAYSITADALSLFPPTSGLGYVMGLPTTAYDMYEDYQKGDIKQMGLDAMGLIPAFKLMKYSKFAKSATQGINMASKFNKAVDVANMANDVNQTIEKKEFGGNITRESEWELVNETNKKLPKRRLNLNKSSDWEIVD